VHGDPDGRCQALSWRFAREKLSHWVDSVVLFEQTASGNRPIQLNPYIEADASAGS